MSTISEKWNKLFESVPRGLSNPLLNLGDKALGDVRERLRAESKLSSSEDILLKYSGEALLAGRPLDTVMIFMGGASGAGKSTTINCLFDDPNLCPTSSVKSETADPTMFLKALQVPDESELLHGKLAFIDVPGCFDTDRQKEARNLASIRKFVETRNELQKRPSWGNLPLPKSFLPRSHVYPNVVLFVVTAGDKRIDGTDSFFSKSLRTFKLTGIFDTERPNLIIVLSHSMAMGRKKDKFAQTLKEKTKIIKQVVKDTLGIKNVEVVPVENDGDTEDLPMENDFYKLPNGDLSHKNLFEAMMKIFDNNKDRLGQLLVGQYFQSDCPEKINKVQATVDDSVMVLTESDVARITEDLQELEEGAVPIYNFQNLGYGYCPVTEEIKPVSLVTPGGSSKLKIVEIGGVKYRVPDSVIPNLNKTNEFHRISFDKKEEYQNHMKASYGLEAGIQLIVSTNSAGRWVRDGNHSVASALVSMVQEIQVASFKLDDPSERVNHAKFLRELENLPDKYGDSEAPQFQRFFSKWGTHLIYEYAVGGAITFNFTVQKESVSSEALGKIEAQVAGSYQMFSGAGNFDAAGMVKGLRAAGVTNEQLKIEGGDPPSFYGGLESVDPDEIKRWSQSVPKKPSELRRSIKLYPFYNLLENSGQCESLRQATVEYLKGALDSKIKAVEMMKSEAERRAAEVKRKALIDPITTKPAPPAKGGRNDVGAAATNKAKTSTSWCSVM